jgi:N-acetylmuramoyl-L-alanine amidase
MLSQELLSTRKIDYLVIHTTAGNQNETPEQMQAYFKAIGWLREGYHGTILKDGTFKRFIDDSKISNGVEPFQNETIKISNENSVNISYVGGLLMSPDGKNVVKDVNGNFIPVDNRTEKQKKTFADVILWYLKAHPGIKFLGHNQISPKHKTCPNFYAPHWCESIGVPKENIYYEDNWSVNKRMKYI